VDKTGAVVENFLEQKKKEFQLRFVPIDPNKDRHAGRRGWDLFT